MSSKVRYSLLAAAAVTVAAGAVGCWYWAYGNNGKALKLAGVVETQEVRLGSKVGGRVAAVEVAEGETVSPGRILVRFDVPELTAQRAQAQARFDAAKAHYERTKAGSRKEELAAAKAAAAAAAARSQRMKAGWREEEVRQAKSELDAAEADRTVTQEEYERTERLFRQGGLAVNRSDYDTARANRDRAQGRYAAASARYEMLAKGSRSEDIAEAAADHQRFQAQYDLLLAGSRAEDIAAAHAHMLEAEGKLKELDAQLAEAEVRAPGHALVEVVGVRTGDLVPPNQPIIRILKLDDTWVKVFVPETELGKVKKGQDVEVTIDSHPGRRFHGKVTQVNSISEFLPRNVQSVDERRNQVFGVKVHVTDGDAAPIFKPGMAAEVYLPLGG